MVELANRTGWTYYTDARDTCLGHEDQRSCNELCFPQVEKLLEVERRQFFDASAFLQHLRGWGGPTCIYFILLKCACCDLAYNPSALLRLKPEVYL